MSHNNLKIAVMCALLAMAADAGAQIRPAYAYPSGNERPSGVQLGGSPFWIQPYVGLAIGRDDNVFQSASNEKRSTTFLLSPGFVIDARGRSSVFQLKHQTSIGRYAQSEDDNYVDHATRAVYDMAFDRRNFLRVGVDYVRGHDPRGSTDRPVAGDPDKYRMVFPHATYSFGAPGAAGRIEVYASELDKRYTNNRATTASADRENTEFGGAFYWRVAPKTYVLVEARHTDIDYRQPNINSGDERRYYGGISWEATAATTGTLKVGRLERQFDIGGEERASSWEGIVTWAPRTYSKFDFYTSRQTNESTGLGRFILSAVGGVTWTHAWSSFLSTGADLRYQKDDYRGFDRKDDIRSIALRAGYKFRPWLTFGAEWTHTNRDSNLPVFEYDRNLYLLTATASM